METKRRLSPYNERRWIIARIRRNFKNGKKGYECWFDIAEAVREVDAPPLKMQREIIEKVFEVFKAIKNVSEKDNVLYFTLVPSKFNEYCDEYGIKRLEEADELDDDMYSSSKEKRKLKEIESEVKKIKKIEIFKDDRYFKVRINNSELVRIKKGKYWNYLYEISVDGKSEMDVDTAKGVEAWFNSNVKVNPIYKKMGYGKTKIVRYGVEFLEAEEGIQIKTMRENRATTQP